MSLDIWDIISIRSSIRSSVRLLACRSLQQLNSSVPKLEEWFLMILASSRFFFISKYILLPYYKMPPFLSSGVKGSIPAFISRTDVVRAPCCLNKCFVKFLLLDTLHVLCTSLLLNATLFLFSLFTSPDDFCCYQSLFLLNNSFA